MAVNWLEEEEGGGTEGTECTECALGRFGPLRTMIYIRFPGPSLHKCGNHSVGPLVDLSSSAGVKSRPGPRGG